MFAFLIGIIIFYVNWISRNLAKIYCSRRENSPRGSVRVRSTGWCQFSW